MKEIRHPRVVEYAKDFVRSIDRRVMGLRQVAALRGEEPKPFVPWAIGTAEAFAREAGELAAFLDAVRTDVAQALPVGERGEDRRESDG